MRFAVNIFIFKELCMSYFFLKLTTMLVSKQTAICEIFKLCRAPSRTQTGMFPVVALLVFCRHFNKYFKSQKKKNKGEAPPRPINGA